MGTRGVVGFRIDGQDKLAYNHWDSYPSGLGEDVVKFIRQHRRNGKLFKSVTEQIRKIEVINKDDTPTPTPAQIKKYKHLADLGVSEQSYNDWYCLLRRLQGNLEGYVDEGVMLDSHDFLNDSLFCEWAYILNLDTDILEVYEGFCTKNEEKGRYQVAAKLNPLPIPPHRITLDTVYSPVTLIAEIPFNAIPAKDRFEKYLYSIGALKEEEAEI